MRPATEPLPFWPSLLQDQHIRAPRCVPARTRRSPRGCASGAYRQASSHRYPRRGIRKRFRAPEYLLVRFTRWRRLRPRRSSRHTTEHRTGGAAQPLTMYPAPATVLCAGDAMVNVLLSAPSASRRGSANGKDIRTIFLTGFGRCGRCGGRCRSTTAHTRAAVARFDTRCATSWNRGASICSNGRFGRYADRRSRRARLLKNKV